MKEIFYPYLCSRKEIERHLGYEEDLKSYSVAWHWHEEFEYILAVKGPLAVDVSKARLVLQTGQGVFVNSGVFHAVEQAETGDALLHSGVFHPRLIGGMDCFVKFKK